MKTQRLLIAFLAALFIPSAALAGFTETLPESTWLVDASYLVSQVEDRWDDRGDKVPLIDETVRYEPGAGEQGTLTPRAKAEYGILVTQLHYGITNSWTLGVGVPVVMYTKVDPRFEWDEGDYQWNLGRSYTENDFWQWAGSMGQPKPDKWDGNHGVLGDIQIGTRWRFSDLFGGFAKRGLSMGAQGFVALPTGTPADPEEAVAAGTTSWELHSNGDIGLHVGLDKSFKESLDERLVLGMEVFYEVMLPHQYRAPEGKKNPLLLNYRPYTGKYYTVDGGDFSGASVQADVVPVKGPAYATWLVKGDAEAAKALPPLLTLSFRYTFIGLQQSDWESNSDIWDYERERLWKPGYKNMLWGQALFSLLRLGAPLQPYVNYRNLTWIPGKNARAPNVYSAGTRILLKFW